MAVDAPARVRVAVEPAYDVVVGDGVTSDLSDFVKQQQIALVSDENVYTLHGEKVVGALESAGKRVHVYPIPEGEKSKSLATFGDLLQAFSEDGLDRSCAVVALGGGVTGDLAGFVAASYLRGVAFYQVPTSLLAMVDASVGGKTGVNLPQGKNLVGAFWQPKAVVADVAYLRTLPEAIFKEGAVEHFKHGLLKDKAILDDIARADFTPNGDPDFLSQSIARSVQVKADIVAADEKEAGVRAHLNLGHTLAHALEAASHRAASNQALSHGDAVAYGLLFMAYLSRARAFDDETERVRDFVRWVAPGPLPTQDFSALEPYMQRDKKVAGGKLRFVLLKRLGKPVIVDDINSAELNDAWQALKESL